MSWNEKTGEYVDCAVSRGFPMGGMGAGGFSIGTDGRFTEFRLNNNWMNPIQNVRGTFFAVYQKKGASVCSRILRRKVPGREYGNIQPVRSTQFRGELPGFELVFDDTMPLKTSLRGFTPHIPHNVKDSSLPGILLFVRLENPHLDSASVSVLLAWENILGLGGTGHTGLKMLTSHIPCGICGRLTYRDLEGNVQHQTDVAGRPALDFRTERSVHPRSHRQGTIGEYLLATECPEGFEASCCDGFNAAEGRPPMIDEFVETGRISSPVRPNTGSKHVKPAGAIAVSGEVPGRSSIEIPFCVAWWTPDHVTEKDVVRKYRKHSHDGVRVGHVYENWFDGPADVVDYLFKNRVRLESESFELGVYIEDSTLPKWLVRAIKNSIDSTLCNSLIPKNGRLYTLEGMDWDWPYGGETGTNDQRLSSHPYTSVFFSELEKTELHAFRKLIDDTGSSPHGHGNCDLALDDADVPYGWPPEIPFVFPDGDWTDLNASEIIQVGKLYRITGDNAFLDEFWPDLKRMADHLDDKQKHGVPEGGTTYDTWSFPGTFIYAATVYLAALRTMIDLAEELEPAVVPMYERRYRRCNERIDLALWRETEGYFRTTPKRNTLFTAGLAGDWAARYAGLQPVIEPHRALRHMTLQYDVLIKPAKKAYSRWGKLPKPWSEARPNGAGVKNKTALLLGIGHLVYIWQVISYQAAEHIYLGQVDKGLDVLKMIYRRFFEKGLLWDASLIGDSGSVYMTHPVVWSVLNALTGAALDVPRGILYLNPQILPGQSLMRVPFFFPGFWAMLEYEPKAGRVRFDVKKSFGEAVVLKQIRCGAPEKRRVLVLEKPIEMLEGASWEAVIGG